jgi:hypothetical protein
MGRTDQRNSPKPFSEQLGLFYAAPLSLVPLLVILALSSAQAFFLSGRMGPFAIVASLVLPIISLRYGMHLLHRFAHGSFDLGAVLADEHRNPYTVYKVIAALLLVGVILALLTASMPPLYWVFIVAFVACAPLVVMLITVTDSFAAGLHMGRWLHAISVLGSSYFWLLAMSFLVTAGSGMISGVLAQKLGGGFAVRLGGGIVSNYAMFVVFCMMGYALFEKADRFGIETHAARRARVLNRPERADAQDLLSRGDVEGALAAAAEEARVAVNDARVQERYFKLLQMRGDESRLLPQATRWLQACAGSRRAEDCARLVKQWWVAHPAMLDDTPQALLDAARLAAQGGAPQEALQMAQHFQQTQRGSMAMPAALLLEADILFSHLRDPAQAKTRLQDLLRLYPNSQAQVLEANVMLKVIDTPQRQPAPAPAPRQP